MRKSCSVLAIVGLVSTLALGRIFAAPDPVFPVYAEIDQPRSNGSTQPVDVMNWLIDENGNLRVSNQVRTSYVLVHSGLVTLYAGDTWSSEPFNVAEYETLFVMVAEPSGASNSAQCALQFRWDESLMCG